ncbi:protein FAM135A-like [Rhipicephalus sanguineus]|uniref:protein FAM135A-like n=1 Tax=Rhipicephalus sanguineus TaxID=34632 RepID=UPI0020C3C659|nr:protein FAM135A-like [Rhipicephalus sanguineus]
MYHPQQALTFLRNAPIGNVTQGCSTDMRLLRVFLELAQPRSNIRFLMSRANEREETFKDFDTLGARLANEIVEHIKKYSKKPARISFIGFSMGNVIIRSALAKAELQPLHRFLHTFLSLCGPHVGTVFNTSMVVNMGE